MSQAIRRLLPSLTAATLLTLASAAAQAELEITFVDVGQGDATLVAHEGQYALIDGGRRLYDVVDHLREREVSALALVAATHAHADHIGGLITVFERLDVGTAWYNGQTHPTQTFERFVDALLNSDAVYQEPVRGDTFALGGEATIEVLHPDRSAADYEGHLHDLNLALRITYGDFAAVITGDLEHQGELEVLDSGVEVGAHVLELGHHGSRTSTHPRFLAAVGPELAVYQAGEDNSYGHPHGEVVERVRGHGAELMGTDTHGTITLIAQRDGSFVVETEREGRVQAGDRVDANGQAGCVDLNAAGAEALQRIPHIGEARAQAIKDGRPWQGVRSLSRLHGIGPARVSEIKAEGVVCD